MLLPSDERDTNHKQSGPDHTRCGEPLNRGSQPAVVFDDHRRAELAQNSCGGKKRSTKAAGEQNRKQHIDRPPKTSQPDPYWCAPQGGIRERFSKEDGGERKSRQTGEERYGKGNVGGPEDARRGDPQLGIDDDLRSHPCPSHDHEQNVDVRHLA